MNIYIPFKKMDLLEINLYNKKVINSTKEIG
jgi:hypothetical protein